MIVDVFKYLIIGTRDDLDRFFDQVQELGFMEFISISGKKPLEQPITVQSLLAAMKILRKYPQKEPYLGGGDLAFAMQVSERVIELKEELEKLQEEKRVLNAEISRVAPFGDFSTEDIAYIESQGKRKIQFFCMKAAKNHKTNFTDEILYIGTEYDLDYFITWNRQSTSYPGMIEMRIDSPVGELEGRLSFVEDAIARFEIELKDYTGHLDFLHDILLDELNKYHLSCAKKEVAYPLQATSFFAIEAWIPHNKSQTLFALMEGMNVHAEQLLVDKNDRVPTCLQNKGFDLIGEDLIKIYDTPATTDKDPSRWVAWFFVLFFAIIVADAGYGLLYLGVAFYLKYKFPHITGSAKRLLKLFFVLSTACIVWGILSSSYFGISLSSDNLLNKFSIVHYLSEKKLAYHMALQDDVYCQWQPDFLQDKMLAEFSSNIILEFTLLIGIFHISLSFMRWMRRNVSGLGWIFFMIGAYLFFPSVIQATIIPNFMGWIDKPLATAVGQQLVYGGIGFALLAALIQRRWSGLNEIANLIQVFADVLSYLRLYALGLASSIMASTFNEEGLKLGLVVGVIAILAGHCINIGLGLMGGLIHGLRLNFLEWYHYCFDGGGKLFKPLYKMKRRD